MGEEVRSRMTSRHMKLLRCLAAVALAGAFAAIPAAQAQDYPSRLVRIVVPQTAGGGTDTLRAPSARSSGSAGANRS